MAEGKALEPDKISFLNLSFEVIRLGRLLWSQTKTNQSTDICGFLITNSIITFITLLLSVLCLVLMTAMDIHFSFVIADWTTAMTDKDEAAFYRGAWTIAWNLLAWLPLNIMTTYLRTSLLLRIQHRFSGALIQQYFTSKSYYHVSNVPNAGIRTLEVNHWIKSCLKLSFKFLDNLTSLIAYSSLLVHISWNLFGTITVFSASVTLFAVTVFFPNLTKIESIMTGQKRDLEYELVNIHRCREQIALMNGGRYEETRIQRKLKNMIQKGWDQLYWLLGLEAFQFAVSRVTSLLPYLVVAPLYFAGEIDYGMIGLSARAFYYVKAAMGFFVGEFDNMAELSAATERLQELVSGLKECKSIHLSLKQNTHDMNNDPNSAFAPSPAPDTFANVVKKDEATHVVSEENEYAVPSSFMLKMNKVALTTPTGEILAKDITFILHSGDYLLITGRSGCGKSSLLRACAGLWKVNQGGSIELGVGVENIKNDVQYLPQTSYFPFDSLRHVLLYPSTCGKDKTIDDGMLRKALVDAKLEELFKRVGLDGKPQRWTEVLSLGEQQRLAFARIFVQRPRLLFADECTSALDFQTEHLLYVRLSQSVETFVSIGHRESLKPFHNTFLHRDDDRWTFHK